MLLCLEDEECTIYFEPWGDELILKQDEIFYVASSAFSTSDVQVSYVRDGISLAFTGSAPVTITDQTGRVLLVL